MSNLPVSSRLKAPASRISKAPAPKSDSIVAPRSSGLKPPSSTDISSKSGLKQPVLKRSNGPQETPKAEKRSALPSSTNAILTPRTVKQNGSLGKSKLGLVAPKSNFGDGAALRRDSSKEVHSTSLRRELSSSQSSLVKEQTPPVLTREKTQESLKDEATGILFKVGDRVLVAGTKSGVIEYLGGTKFAKGLWAGVKLDEAEGKNDGSVAGVRYFDCQPLHGVFSKPNRLHKINIVSKNSTSDVNTILSESLKIGDEVLVGGSKLGILRYLGPTEFAKGEWAGVELKEPLGKNDGAVAGTRYFTCEMLYGLFAPSSKVTKSKKKVFNAKQSNSPIPSLDVAAKMVFTKTSSIDSDVASETLPHLPSPGEKHIAEDDDLSKSNESHHIGLKKTTSNTQQVVALQSALEEREREIHKMLVERENEKVNDVTLNGKSGKNSINEQLLKDKDDIINALKANLQTAKSENSLIQAKLDEEKKKYEELQFMLEEEKITDDELKDHVKQDETTIKELSSQYEEKNLKITELQNELREARLDKQANEAKLKELRVELDESRNDFESLKRSVDTTNKDSDHKLEISLETMKKELHESKQLLIKKDHESSELQKMLNDQREYMEKERVNLNDRLSLVENEKTEAKGNVLRMKQENESLNEELRQYKHMNIEIETNLKIREEKLQTLERKYNELSKENLAAMSEKDENSKITLMNLNARITELEGELIEAKANVSQLENNMALERDIAKQKEKQLDDHLVNAKKQLEESIEDSKIKQQVANDMENKLNNQLNREKEIIKEKEELDQAFCLEKEVLQSDINSLTLTINDLREKQNILAENHRIEISSQISKAASKEKELLVLIKECERLKDETVSAKENLQMEYKNLETKCRELTQKNVELVAERNDVIKLCDEQDKQLDALKTEEGKLTLERDSLLKEKDELSIEVASLESQIETINSESGRQKNEQQEAMESRLSSLKSQLEIAKKENVRNTDLIDNLQKEKKTLEHVIATKTNEINKLKDEQVQLQEKSEELESQVSNLSKKMSDAAENASLKTKGLNSEVLILKEDFEEAKNALKEKEDEIRIYQEQIEKMGNDDFPKSPMDGDILENASALMLRLHEAESKLAVVQSEKESAEEQVEFLNSIIVDLKNKNQKAEQTIALLEASDEPILLQGLESDSDDDDDHIGKPKYSLRKFCDICDVFDQHETDECPLQESGEGNEGSKHHGDRNMERPYCGICEVFDHWTEDCNDEQTF